jgi:hypothetical protein
MRRKEWLESRKGKKRPDMDNDVSITSPYDKESAPVGKKRKRAPNRPKDVIAAEKRLKEDRKLAKSMTLMNDDI